MKSSNRLILFFILMFSTLSIVFGQEKKTVFQDSLLAKLRLYNLKRPSKVLFAHFDKTVDSTNERIYFTAYSLRAGKTKDNLLSFMLLKEGKNDVVLTDRFVMGDGVGFGNVSLPDTLTSGNYSCFLYTNDVINTYPQNVFVQGITIKNTREQSFSASLTLLDSVSNKNELNSKILLRTSSKDNMIISDAQVDYFVGNELHPIISGKVFTDKSGQYIFSIPTQTLSIGNNVLYTHIKYKKGNNIEEKNLRVALPFKQSPLLVKFYPEGGSLSDNVVSTVGWEVKDIIGLPVKIKAILYENKKRMDTISTDNYGVGKFLLKPKKTCTYFVKLLSPLTSDSLYLLPKVLSNLPVLSIEKAVVNDTVKINVKSNAPSKIFIIVHNFHELFCFIPTETDNTGKKINIDLTNVPKGIAEVTVLDSLRRPCAERLIFVHYNHRSQLAINTDKQEYNLREKVNLKLNITGPDGNPVAGLFSIACVQANRLEPNKINSIENYYFLNSQLGSLRLKSDYKGIGIEDQNYLENILLIKGWRKYSWIDLMQTVPKDTIMNQDSLRLVGKVTYLNKTVKKPIKMFALNNSSFTNFSTEPDGSFILQNEKLYVSNEESIHLFANDNHPENYHVSIDDPYLKINNSIALNHTPEIDYSIFAKDQQDNSLANIKGLDHVIQLNEVKINARNGDLASTKNSCGDYVCIFNILNCTNHRESPLNRPAVAGERYTYMGRENYIYKGCNTGNFKYSTPIDGIKYAMEFYPLDSLQVGVSEPEYLSTIYWSHLKSINGINNAISFYTGDITGPFKIIIQGITQNDVFYSEKTIKVTKK